MTIVVSSAPAFLDQLPLSRAAWEYAREVHGGQTRVADGAAFIEHPCEVALLLHAAGAPDPLVAAGLLHDTHERTATTRSDLTLRFGPEVAALVAAVTEQPSIRSYRQRKAALRKQATEAANRQRSCSPPTRSRRSASTASNWRDRCTAARARGRAACTTTPKAYARSK